MAQAGCVRWQPELKLDPEIAESKRKYICLYSLEGNDNVENNEELSEERKIYLEMSEQESVEKAEVDFSATYGHQRQFLNNLQSPPSVADVKKIWPILLFKNYYFWHYGFLTNMQKIYQIMKFVAMKKFLKS